MLKRNHRALETFSMSSMTDVVFLLLIFFMVTSTLIIPSAIDVNLPQSGEQSPLKPQTEVYIDSEGSLFLVADRNDSTAHEARQVTRDELLASLMMIQHQDSTRHVALYADSTVRYARVVEVLDMAARHGLPLVLATRPR
ncbi:MAG: biopolymer transporter ExbD [Muribaculaceae bacterium]|nr:biopolymer transporter ExbD [Muribaculaceae bacterium]MDE7109332.1 biopolymer transporter ExbD [Muribaculaceae bacterium]